MKSIVMNVTGCRDMLEQVVRPAPVARTFAALV